MTPDGAQAFVEAVGAALGTTGTTEHFGVSKILACRIDGRAVRVSANGSFYSIDVDLEWDIPTDVGIMWAPLNSYKRAKLFELEEGPPPTGDQAFDDLYVIVGIGSAADRLVPRVSPGIRAALVDHADIRPEIRWLDAQVRQRLHIRSEPPLNMNETMRPVFGEGLYTAGHAAFAVRRTIALAGRIETNQR
jgi:hypothetical protein